MNTQLTLSDNASILVELRARLMFLQQICEAQKCDSELQTKRIQCKSSDDSEFQIDSDDCLRFQGRICVPKDTELIQKILNEAHNVKPEHQVPSVLLHPVMVPEWNWDRITMDFVTDLPLTLKKKDAVCIVVDILTKSAYFTPVHIDLNYTLLRL
ncbi:uncharacterized protein LOC108481483 [Gossypium arboreum]|uniref:uncharacterized protein LOC108481483 n=1 Tax=Gossypium arboreum TaxID=29729 RepID=UPI000819199A|nr:uncharacterized protein LOC108481483 [Gossypium arboreum]